MKIRKCPNFKSKKEFALSYKVVGSGIEQRNFSGKLQFNERSTTDIVDNYVSCLNCKALIELEKVKTD